MRLDADVMRGQKTGLFLDHRESRRRVRDLARGLTVLNLYGYTGGFSIAAALGGAERVDTVDRAAPALELAEKSWEKNSLDAARQRVHEADALAFLEGARGRGQRWGLVIADPPSFAPNEASLPAALSQYRKLHALALSVLVDGGLYLGASCSSHVRREVFMDTLLSGAGDARRSLQLLDAWGAPGDHPRLPAFPEGDYLKVVLTRAFGA
jgi:23S rRNA (cytosine1962-C5)-methyltransferase